MSNVSMINGHIDESKGTMCEIKTAMGCMSGYPCEECNIEECRVNDIPQPIIDLIKRLKADKEALIKGQESLMKHLERKKEIITELDAEVESLKVPTKHTNYEPIIASVVDNVNHPQHYETGGFECIDVMLETQGVEAVKNFCICNAFKYLYRHKRKNGAEDIKKARWYIDKFIELLEKEGAE